MGFKFEEEENSSCDIHSHDTRILGHLNTIETDRYRDEITITHFFRLYKKVRLYSNASPRPLSFQTTLSKFKLKGEKEL